MRKFLLCFFLSIPIFTVYQPLKDYQWSSCHSAEYIAEYKKVWLPVNYKFCTVGSSITSEQIDELIVETTQLAFDFADSKGVRGNQCVLNNDLEIYIYDIDMKTLNTPGRFPTWTNPSPIGIWALYDPRLSEENISSLMITDHGKNWNEITFAHEISHYWFDRLCWNKSGYDLEKFAIEFESFYVKNRSK